MDLPPPATLSERVRTFLEQPLYPTLATVGEDGTPHQAVIWYRLEPDDRILVNSRAPRRWPTELQRDGRGSLAVTDLDDPFKWVAVSEPAELTEDGADQQIDKLAKKYLGKDEYPWRKPEETRVKVLIEPEHVDASGLDE